MESTLWFGLLMPLVGFLFLLLASDRIRRSCAGWIACTALFLSFLSFCWLLHFYTEHDMKPITTTLFQWIPIKGIEASWTLRLDSLSLLMALIITGVGFLIHVYSNGYMEHDEDYARYFACMNFFIFSMLLLVLAGHLLVLFVGWEGVGLASYLLIGFYYHRPAAAQAATKAFVINRIGDAGFLVGLLLTFQLFGTGDIVVISEKVGREFTLGAPILLVLTLLYFVGATGKSAQLPLYTWLPDAMEGPTPVSALIHAATMVTAGVYLVVRMHPVFLLAPATLHFIGIVGTVTALFAALCALAQTDLKRVLAYSTVSQLGYMFVACGVGAFYSAMFHLTIHAFMKALLFLAAGNVIHMMQGTTEMEKMGGLAKKFPKTHWFFLIGVLAMSGVPPLAAFFSKDLILELDYLAGFKTLFYIGLITAILTAFYLTRAYCLTFLGKPRLPEKIYNLLKEPPSVMVIPVAILAFLSLVGGFLGFAFGKIPLLERFLQEVGISAEERLLSVSSMINPETFMSVAGAILGIGSAALLYLRYSDRLGQPIALLKNSFYVNEIYWKTIAVPLRHFANWIGFTLEPQLFDKSIQATAKTTLETATLMQRLQSGQIRSYIAWMALGTGLLIVYFVFVRI